MATAAGSAPRPLFAVANPTVVEQGGMVTLGVKVIPGTEPPSTGIAVTADLTSIGGSSSQQLFDDGTNGDMVPNDNLFVFDATVAASTPTGQLSRPISVTITDAEGRSGAAEISFLVTAAVAATNDPPTVAAGGPYSVAEGASTLLSATGSDPNGDPLTYVWDLDDDGTFETTGSTATFSAAALDGPSARTVRIRASDATARATSEATVTITNVAPTATFSAPDSAFAGSAFTLALTNAADPSAADVAAGLQYAFDCGNGYGAFGPAASASCSASAVGTRSVGGEIRDKDGSVSEYRVTMSVVLTFSSLCDLTKRLTTDGAIAAALCAKLDAAAASAARGNVTAKQGDLAAYRNQLDAQTGKTISGVDAGLLKRLSVSL